MVLLGSLVNGLAIVAGSLVGMILQNKLKQRFQDTIVLGLGVVVIYIGITSFSNSVNSLNILLSIAIGGWIGELLDLDGKVHTLANWLQNKFSKDDSHFASGFSDGVLLFCVGSMAILGSIQSGLLNEHTTLLTKAVIDGIMAIFFAAKNGVGVAFSGVAVFLYEGVLTLCASLLSPVLTDACISHISVVGGIMLVMIGLGMCDIKKFKSMNYVPAVIFSLIITLIIV